jgi:hypothetical protein
MGAVTRRLLLLGLVPLLLPASAGAYGVKLQERFSTGTAGASPDIALAGSFSASGDERLGLVSFGLPQELLPQPSLEALAAAPAGTQIGYATSNLTGAANRLALRINTATPSVVPGLPPTLYGAMDVPALLAQLGAPPLPFTLSFSGGQAVLAVDLRPVVQRLGGLRVDQITVVLAGSYSYGGSSHPLAVVPVSSTFLQSTLTAQPCGDAACSVMGLPTAAAVSGSLPRAVTLRAPRTARSGALATFTGTGTPGDLIQLYRRDKDGGYVRVSGSATVPASGRFTLRGRPKATARYAVLAVQNGSFAVSADAAGTTRVLSP